MRLFIAVYPADTFLKDWTHFHKSAGDWPVRWGAHEQLHITLKFLENIDEAAALRLEHKLIDAAHTLSPFSLTPKGGGVFPERGTPSVFWVGFEDPKQQLSHLAQEIERVCEQEGFPKEERAFHAHLTVGRAMSRTHFPPHLREAYLSWIRGFNSAVLSVDKFSIVESRLSGGGAHHTIRRRYLLQGLTDSDSS